MTATVTVLGASGTIAVPFQSAVNATFSAQLANQISVALGSSLTATPYNPAAATATDPQDQLVIGGSAPTAPAASSYVLPNNYTAVVNNANAPVTVTAGMTPVAPMSIIGGTGGTTFFGGASSMGGGIALGGGANTIAGAASAGGALDSTNGGLVGDWTISSGSSHAGSSDDIFLASGSDTLLFGANDTVHAGGASVLGLVTNTDAVDPTFFIGSSPSTVFGLSSANLNILGNDGATGGGVYVLGTGGNGVITAGAGNSTLVGGGAGDVIYASSAPGAQAVMFGGAGPETLMAGFGGGNSTLYGGAGNDVLALNQTNPGDKDVAAAGAGTDTIFSGIGQDSIWFYQPVASKVHDTIYNFDISTNTLILAAYGGGAYTVTSSGSAPLQLTLSDSSTITFTNLTTSQAGQLKITTIG